MSKIISTNPELDHLGFESGPGVSWSISVGNVRVFVRFGSTMLGFTSKIFQRSYQMYQINIRFASTHKEYNINIYETSNDFQQTSAFLNDNNEEKIVEYCIGKIGVFDFLEMADESSKKAGRKEVQNQFRTLMDV